jgi:hypothetical protein
MGNNIEKDIRIAFDPEIKPPAAVHPGLPAIAVVLLGPQGRVLDIPEKVRKLFAKQPLHLGGSGYKAISEWFSYDGAHVLVA